MRFGRMDRFLTGVSVPVSVLRSRKSCGVGEFADLPLLGRWCASAGIDLIQILPVNDTGTDSSPYSALSAFALHPLYLRLQSVRGASRYSEEIESFRGSRDGPGRFSYPEVLAFKLSIAQRIFSDGRSSIVKDKSLSSFREANPWLDAYAAFKALKSAGSVDRGKTPEEIRAADPDRCHFYSWLQFLLQGQLAASSEALEKMGVRLKGDIPILMNEDSADVWSTRKYFDLSLTAGAPPDMYAADGQNWRFPLYDWDALARDGYSWWKARISRAAEFFHAFRIDHVLGFFRIWGIPRTEKRAILGRFLPSVSVTRADLHAAGCDDGRIRWLSVPHVRGAEMSARADGEAGRIREAYFDRIGAEDLYTLKPEMDSEAAVLDLEARHEVRDFMIAKHADRALIPLPDGSFAPAWYFWTSTPFKSLDGADQERLRALFQAKRGESEAIWEKRGSLLLGVLRNASDMLVCAEDLGDVPACVPRVLSDLGILGLRVARWTRDYDAPGAPFVPPDRYPRMTVCAASVHDTSTLRGWWEESPAEREAYFRHLGLPGGCPERMSPEVFRAAFEHLLEADSLICMFQLQDILDLDPGLWSADPAEDRVNVPGTVNGRNWTWRMPLPLEELAERGRPASDMRALAGARAKRKTS